MSHLSSLGQRAARAMEVRAGESRFSTRRLAAFRAAYEPEAFDQGTLSEYMLAQEPPYTVCYAPVDAWPGPKDRIVFVGMTPGFQQMQKAAQLFMELPRDKRKEGLAYSAAVRQRAAFAGSMRTNLCEWLDKIGLPDEYGVDCAENLFSARAKGVATTSALVFPTFKDEENLHSYPPCTRIPMFDEMLASLLLPRLDVAKRALIVPLGSAAQTLLLRAISNREARTGQSIDNDRILTGLPHPSNGRGRKGRIEVFNSRRASLRRQIHRFFQSIRN